MQSFYLRLIIYEAFFLRMTDPTLERFLINADTGKLEPVFGNTSDIF